MFDLMESQVHWIPVRWSVLMRPAEGDGLSTPTETEVELKVELVDREETIELFPNFFATDEEDTSPLNLDEQLRVFKRLVSGWRKVAANGRQIEMDEENILKLLKVPMFPAAFANAYIQALGGVVEIREGNSEGSPRVGRAARASKPETRS